MFISLISLSLLLSLCHSLSLSIPLFLCLSNSLFFIFSPSLTILVSLRNPNDAHSNEVLTFVNKIAEIVHSNIHNWRGQCNKNLGNAFIVVWRIGDQSTLLVTP